MSIRVPLFGRILTFLWLQSVAGCGPLELTCTEDSLQTYCANTPCPQSPRVAIDEACGNYPQVWRDGESVIIGISGGFGAHTYHFSEGKLVGIEWWTDALTPYHPDVCPEQRVYGEVTTDVWRLDTLSHNEPYCIAQADCIASCTFCADYERYRPGCSKDVFDSPSY